MPKNSMVLVNHLRRRSAAMAGSALPCTVTGCKNTVGKLSKRFCRKHLRSDNKHGSAFCGDLPWRLTQKTRARAKRWLAKNQDNPWVRDIIANLDRKIAEGPEPLPFKHWVRKDHDWRVHRSWGHLKANQVTGLKVLQEWLTVELAIRAHHIQTPKYRLAQIARKVHRLMTGTWPAVPKILFITLDNGEPGIWRTKDKRYQPAWGRYAQNWGKAIDDMCNHLLDHADILNPDLKKRKPSKPAPGSPKRPYVKRNVAYWSKLSISTNHPKSTPK